MEREALIGFDALREQLGGVSRGTVYNMIAKYPNFPKPVVMHRHKMWKESQVSAFIASLPHEGDDDAA